MKKKKFTRNRTPTGMYQYHELEVGDVLEYADKKAALLCVAAARSWGSKRGFHFTGAWDKEEKVYVIERTK